jgi:hypothetical protein
MTLKLCLIDINQSPSWVIVLVFPVFIGESLAIFFGSSKCSDANKKLLNEMVGTII